MICGSKEQSQKLYVVMSEITKTSSMPFKPPNCLSAALIQAAMGLSEALWSAMSTET